MQNLTLGRHLIPAQGDREKPSWGERALHIQGATKGEMLFLYKSAVSMVYTLLSGPAITLNPLIMTLREFTVILILKMCKQGHVWKPTSSLIPSSQVMLLLSLLANVREEYAAASSPVSFPHEASIFHPAPVAPGPAVSSRMVLARHRRAPRSDIPASFLPLPLSHS